MPFNGNNWDKSKLVTQKDILHDVVSYFGSDKLVKLEDNLNFISRDYQISGFMGSFGIISSVSNPFCDGCNRIRLTANGKLKNCLFSNDETDILSSLRNNETIEPLIAKTVYKKFAIRANMDTFKKLNNPELHSKNRSMLTIGG